MDASSSILTEVRKSAGILCLYTPHAVSQMMRPDRTISKDEVQHVIFEGIVIEDYPEDVRGHSCLLLGRGESNRSLHVVCSPKAEYLAIITAYVPDPEDWTDDFTRRIAK